jgi:hypothetical protein
MGDTVESYTLNGETTKVVNLNGTGSRQFKLDYSGDWTTLLLTWRWIWTGPASNPTPTRPSVFVGLCTQGQTFHDTPGGHALGLRAFSADFRLDPFTFTDNGFYFVAAPWLTENGSTTQVSTAYGQWIGRYEKAAGTQAFGLLYNKFSGTHWFSQPCVCNGAWNATNMSHNEFYAGATIPKSLALARNAWNEAYDPPNVCYDVNTGGTFVKPDEASYGTLDSLLLDWEIDDTDHSCLLHDIHLTRLE